MNKTKKPIVYAFIDSQNLNLGTHKDIYRNKKKIYSGCQLDFQKFRVYLSDKFRVSKAFLFIGFIKENHQHYDRLKSFGYELVFKPTTKDGEGRPKGNIDAELVLYAAAIEYSNFDKAVVVSGDGDFYCLHQYLIDNHKLQNIVIPNRYSESNLLRGFQEYKIFINRERGKLILKQKTGGVAK